MKPIWSVLQDIHRDLCPSEQKVFDFIWLETEGNEVTIRPISLKTIMDGTGLSHYTVFRYLKQLIKNGYIAESKTIQNKGTIYGVTFYKNITSGYEDLIMKTKNSLSIGLDEFKQEMEVPKSIRRNFVVEARELTKYLQIEYAKVLMEAGLIDKVKKLWVDSYRNSNQGIMEKHLRENRDRTPEDFKRNIDVRLSEKYWLTKGLGFRNIINNFDRPKFKEKKKKESRLVLNFE